VDVARAGGALVRRLLTAAGEALWWELRGDPVLPIHVDRPPHKMLSRGGSLGGPTAGPERLLGWLARNTERLVEELEFHRVAAGRLSGYLMHRGGTEGPCRGGACAAPRRPPPPPP